MTPPRKNCKILVGTLAYRYSAKGNRLHLLILVHHFARSCTAAVLFTYRLAQPAWLSAVAMFQSANKKTDIYNILWTLVFGFATLNILSLVAKRFEPHHNRMTFGEVMAITTVVVAVFLLGWEMLYLFKILPLHLSSH